MERLICLKCGAPLEQHSDNLYKCKHCGLTWRDDIVQKEVVALRSLLSEEKWEKIANLKRQLWTENNKPYLDSKEIVRLCKAIKAYNPDDFYANFYEATNNGYDEDFCAALNGIDVAERYDEVENLIEYCLRSITPKNMLAICNLIERAFKERDPETYGRIRTKYDVEAQKADEGVYYARTPRDVFVCYSSKDMAKVEELVQYLEDNDLTCFVAVRNLQHGRGAKEKYWDEIKAAIENCKCLVFLSSVNSRTLKCDAIRELQHVMEYNDAHPAKAIKKIEYLIDAYKGVVVEKNFKRVFDGLEYCYDKETVLERLCDYMWETAKDVAPVAKPVEPAKSAVAPVAVEPAKPVEQPKPAVTAKPAVSSRLAKAIKSAVAELAKPVVKPAQPAVVKPVEVKKTEPAKVAAKKVEQPKAVETAKSARAVSAFEYEKNGNAVTITKYVGKDKEVVIPATIEGLPVTNIAQTAFICSTLTSVVIPDSVTSIGVNAFRECSNLASVVIPDSVMFIDSGAFFRCSSLTSVVIPNGVMSIDDSAFYECSSLTSVVIPDSVTSIGKYAFSQCDSLTSLVIPKSVTSIGTYAFFYCSSLTSVVISDSVTSIGRYAFYGCRNLLIYCEAKNQPSGWDNEWNGSDGQVEWGYNAKTNMNPFEYEKKGNAVTITKYVGQDKDVVIPKKIEGLPVKSIGEDAFLGCANLTSVVIPKGVISIGRGTFLCCNSLTRVVIPNSVTSIGNSAFFECSSLKRVEIPNGVTSIGSCTFSGCSRLTSVKIPNGVTSIGEEAFKQCSVLTSAKIPSGVTSIGSGALLWM